MGLNAKTHLTLILNQDREAQQVCYNTNRSI